MAERPGAAVNRYILLSFLSTLLFLQSVRAFFASIYYQNLVTLSINASVLFTLLLFSPVIYLLPRVSASRWTMVFSLILLAFSRIAMNLSWGTGLYLPLSGLAVASFLVLLPSLLHASKASAEQGWLAIGMGLVLALALDAAIVLSGLSRDPSTGPSGLFLTLPVAAFMVYLSLTTRQHRMSAVPSVGPPRWKTALAGLSFGAWLFLEYAVLSSAYVIARWNSLPVAAAALGTILGLLVPAASTMKPLSPPSGPMPMAVMSTLALATFLDYSLFHSAVLPLLLLLGQAALVMSLFYVLSSLHAGGPRQTATALIYSALILLVLIFVFVFALAYGYIPLGAVWEGSEVALFPVAALTLILTTAAISGGFRESLKMPRLPRAVPGILIILPLLITIISIAPPVHQEPSPGTTLRVLTYNVHQGFNNAGAIDPEIFTEVVEAADADLVALQESDTARLTSANLDMVAYLATRLGYDSFYGPPTWEQSFGIALLSRHTILEASYILLTSSEDKRALLQARIDVSGEEVWVFVTHLALGAEDREVQTREILAHTSRFSGHHILAGDFNSCPSGSCSGYVGPHDTVYEMVTSVYQDAWTEAGFDVDEAAGYTYSAVTPFERIDYIFVSDEISVSGAERIRTEAAIDASDHLPVLATVEVAG